MSVLKIKNSQGEFEPVLTIDPTQEVADWMHGNAADTIDGWLDDNIMQETGYVLDRSLTSVNAAAPADMVGGVKSAIDDYDTPLIVPIASDTSKTQNGVIFVIGNGICSVTTPNGAATGNAFIGIYYDQAALPAGIEAGKEYLLKYVTTDSNVFGYIIFYNSSGSGITSITTTGGEELITIPGNAVGMLMRIRVNSGTQITGTAVVSDFNMYKQRTMKDVGKEFDEDTVALADSVNEIKSARYAVGKHVRTRGFATPGDNGAALYEIKAPGEDTVNNITVFKDNRGLIIKRIFDEPYIYLESLNFSAYPYATINSIIEATGITDVRCGDVTTPYSIKITNYNLTFNTITYTGDSAALVLEDLNHRIIRGRKIVAVSAANVEGIRCQTSGATSGSSKVHFYNNLIEVQDIVMTGIGLNIRPMKGRGILQNVYRIGRIYGMKYSGGTGPKAGIQVNIAAERDSNGYVMFDESSGKPLYSFEGEDHFDVSLITVDNRRTNDQGQIVSGSSARAVYMTIEAGSASDRAETVPEEQRIGENDVGASIYGTITGVHFTNLSCEGSNIGISLQCGEKNPADSCRSECGIKSIYIDHLRVREGLNNRFIDMNGWLRDIYVRPSSKMNLRMIMTEGHRSYDYDANDNVIYPIKNTSDEAVVIDSGIYNSREHQGSYLYDYGIGEKAYAKNGILYFAKQTPETLAIVQSGEGRLHAIPTESGGEYTVTHFTENSYPCVSRFYIDDAFAGVSGTPTVLNLDLREYYSVYSITGVMIRVPAYCLCKIRLAEMEEYAAINTADGTARNYTLHGTITDDDENPVDLYAV